MEDLLEDALDMSCIVVGDLNGRCGTLGGIELVDETKQPRNTRDTVINEEGVKWIKLMDEFGLTILNGNREGEWRGEITHVDYRSQSIIDNGAGNCQAWKNIESMRVGSETSFICAFKIQEPAVLGQG